MRVYRFSRLWINNAFQLASGVDVDCIRGKMYWTDTKNKQVNMANLDGTEREVFYNERLRNIEPLSKV